MTGYRLTPLAENDLEDIWLYTFKHWTITQADSYVVEITSTIEKLASGHVKGRATDVRPGYLKYPAGKHLLFFRVKSDEIEVVRILDQSMDHQRHL